MLTEKKNFEYDSPLETKIIDTEQGQAILIPKKYQTEQKELLIKKDKGVYTIWPLSDPWLPTKNVMGMFPEDFMEDREQPVLNV